MASLTTRGGEGQAMSRIPRPGHIRIGISGWSYARLARQLLSARPAPAPTSCPTPAGRSTRSRSTAPIIRCSARIRSPDGTTRRRTGFVFAIKGSRFITHLKQLHDIETPLANFFASGVLRLEDKLGPFLWQFSPRFRFDAERLDHFSRCCRGTPRRPRPRRAARSPARRAAPGRAPTEAGALRHAIEIRHPSFLDPAFVALLRRHDIALVFADTVGVALCRGRDRRFRLSAPARLRRALCQRLFGRGARPLGGAHHGCGRAGARAERRAADRPGQRPPRRPRDVYVYFDNDAKVRAPFDARSLRAKLTGRS